MSQEKKTLGRKWQRKKSLNIETVKFLGDIQESLVWPSFSHYSMAKKASALFEEEGSLRFVGLDLEHIKGTEHILEMGLKQKAGDHLRLWIYMNFELDMTKENAGSQVREGMIKSA